MFLFSVKGSTNSNKSSQVGISVGISIALCMILSTSAIIGVVWFRRRKQKRSSDVEISPTLNISSHVENIGSNSDNIILRVNVAASPAVIFNEITFEKELGRGNFGIV